jgi:hypothetical protein
MADSQASTPLAKTSSCLAVSAVELATLIAALATFEK